MLVGGSVPTLGKPQHVDQAAWMRFERADLDVGQRTVD